MIDHTNWLPHLDDETLSALVDEGRAEQEKRRVAAMRVMSADDFVALIKAQDREKKAAEIQQRVYHVNWRLEKIEQDLREGKLDASWHFRDCEQCLRAIYARKYVGLCLEGRESFQVLLNH